MEQKRRNWLMCFVTLVLVSGLAGGAFAVDVKWDGGGSNNLWTTQENWEGDVLPIDDDPLAGDSTIFDDPFVPQPLVCDGVTASVRGFTLSSDGSTSPPCVLTVTGGSLTFTGDKMMLGTTNGGEGILNMSGGNILAADGIIVGNWQAVGGTFNMSGGTFTSEFMTSPGTGWWDQFCVGNEVPGTLNMSGGAITATGDMILSRANGSGTVNMTDGTIDISGTIFASYATSKSSEFNLDGGVVTAGALSMNWRGRLYLTEGVMVLDGDATATVQGYINNGWITAYGTQSAVIVDYDVTNSGKTTIMGCSDLTPPAVEAGENQAVLLQDGAVQLAGTATDDGEPNPSLDIEWTRISGPVTVVFDPCNTVEAPAVTFPEAGTYVLRLTADDGQTVVYDEVTIMVDNPTCQDVIDDGLKKASDVSGPEGTPDCYVDLYDFAFLAGEWLSCSNPQDHECELYSTHIRIITWNIEHLGYRTPIRTTAQRELVGERMLDMGAAVFLLQEIGDDNAFATVVNRMNELSSDNWTSYRNGRENAIVYNTDKLEIIEAPKHWPDPGDAAYPSGGSRPPVTMVFKAVGGGYSFRVVGIHIYPYDEQIKINQGQWLNDKVQVLLNDPEETHNIIVCGDYNPGEDPLAGWLRVFEDGEILFNVPKENGPGTGWGNGFECDFFSVTSSSMAKIKGGTCYVNDPEEFGETYLEFEATYSDHFPVFIDVTAP